MRNLKFLHFPAALPVFAAITVMAAAFLAGCAGTRTVASPAAAEKIAVDLANDKCQHEYGKRPFKTGQFPATLSGDRWLWGWLDARGGQGYTAQVSFHADQSQPQVAVNFGADAQVDMEEPDAPSMNGTPDPGALSRQPEPQEAD
ncbi:MAG: hypothetical protein JWO30_1409 [Fibrobacteres bacterium]|nr:hypothetical protein [Fibrobacterota bacterium]